MFNARSIQPIKTALNRFLYIEITPVYGCTFKCETPIKASLTHAMNKHIVTSWNDQHMLSDIPKTLSDI